MIGERQRLLERRLAETARLRKRRRGGAGAMKGRVLARPTGKASVLADRVAGCAGEMG